MTMQRERYQAGRAGEATVKERDGRWTLVFVRELRHPPERVWRALTDPAELREWAPFDPDRDLGATGSATLLMAGGEPEPLPATIRRAERPKLLEYTWGDDVLRWELEPSRAGTRLTLRQTVADRSWLTRVAAGWHMCLDVAERAMDGAPVGRIVAADAKQHGWERLEREYAERFGLPSTGWPG
jgi:uncharacterized protein YndB with AHSA1/START domain